jgi:hypothetical protein
MRVSDAAEDDVSHRPPKTAYSAMPAAFLDARGGVVVRKHPNSK